MTEVFEFATLPWMIMVDVSSRSAVDIVSCFPDILELEDRSFRLAGITMYRSGHYVSVLKSEEGTWIFYDGMVNGFDGLNVRALPAHKLNLIMLCV